jgi:uncharacterized membrane protein YeaQ/YmgE (transglycosylase-associated protein family)
MGQAIQNIDEDAHELDRSRPESKSARILPALVGAIVCTALIAEAIVTALHGRQNGDLMVIVCPILGAIFLSIPAVRAWWFVISELLGRQA